MSSFRYWGGGCLRGRYGVEVPKTSWWPAVVRDGVERAPTITVFVPEGDSVVPTTA
ncbi:hypothetical protein OG407_01685 [Streptomyces sp. NBC_01515]|uniref:hypothetical protein n=1 Tax=Streptomyces sp. NBC_01515 TaxID=2903890 RepID=UPI00386EBC78